MKDSIFLIGRVRAHNLDPKLNQLLVNELKPRRMSVNPQQDVQQSHVGFFQVYLQIKGLK